MSEPLISVKMITYNHAPYIVQAIEGVLRQNTNFPFELVIGEDCSTDGTREIVFEYEKKYPDIIRVVTSEKNVGMKKNSIRTFNACRGKYIAVCEGDDYWHRPEKLQKQADYLESHPECGLVYSSYNVYFVKEKKQIVDYFSYRKMEIPESPNIIDIIDGKGVPLTCTVMVRRNLCKEIIELDPYLHQSDHFLMGDTQMWAEMSTRAHLHYIPETLAVHNITEESATRSKDVKKVLRFSVSNAEVMLYLCKKYGLPQWLINKCQIYFDESSLRLALYSRNQELAHAIRKKKETFTLKEWLQYYGAGNVIFYYIYRLSASTLNFFKERNEQWL